MSRGSGGMGKKDASAKQSTASAAKPYLVYAQLRTQS